MSGILQILKVSVFQAPEGDMKFRLKIFLCYGDVTKVLKGTQLKYC